MKTKLLITLLLAVALAPACSEMNPHSVDMSQALQKATTKADHEALAKHYEEAANEMQLMVDEHQKLLSQYEEHAYLYGRQAEDLKSHCEALINIYKKAVEENLNMAKLHRQM